MGAEELLEEDHLLWPQVVLDEGAKELLTAAQDLWHQSSNTWFDRTADLRVVLNSEGTLVPTGDKTLAVELEERGYDWVKEAATA